VKGINPFWIKLFPVINFFLSEIIYETDITTYMFDTDWALIYRAYPTSNIVNPHCALVRGWILDINIHDSAEFKN
jgi:hypothetical protein